MDWFLYDNGLRHERVKGNEKCGEVGATPSFFKALSLTQRVLNGSMIHGESYRLFQKVV